MQMDNDMVSKQLLEVLEETFERAHGIYLDTGTSIFETLKDIPFEKVSIKFHNIPETIAAHVHHSIFYIEVLIEYITGKRTGHTDWSESWAVSSVTEAQWSELQLELKKQYESVKEFISGIDEWKNDDYLGGSIAIIAHCAFHLALIRQLKDL